MVFLPGDHTLDTNITVANVARLAMHGGSSSGNRATVVCNGSVGLSFTSMVEFKIHSLAFISCSRNLYVGTYALHLQSTQYAELVNCSFHDNNGTALVVNNTNITLSGNTEFTHNHCKTCIGGGGIFAFNSNLTVLTFNETSNFIGNSALGGGGAICASENTVLSFNGMINFISNKAGGGGAIFTSENTVLCFNGTSNFINNLAIFGGAIFTYHDTVLSFNGTNNFINNSAYGDGGGAIYTSDTTVLSFNGINNFIYNTVDGDESVGGAILTSNDVVLSFNGINNFISNSATDDGGAIYASGHFSFDGTSNFVSNSAGDNGGAITANGNAVLGFTGSCNFINNSAGDDGGAIYTSDNALHFNGGNNFINNSANYGGALHLSNSTFSILPSTTVYWENNHASYGGAIYIDDSSNPFIYCTQVKTFTRKGKCFFQFSGQNLSSGLDAQLVFKNNSADAAGSVLYGGAIDNCTLTGLDSYSSGEVFDMLVHIDDDNTNSSISSDPFRIYTCKNNHPVCADYFKLRNHFKKVYPGETFTVSVVAVGQRDGVVPSGVKSYISTGNLLGSQYLQQANNTCTMVHYTVLLSTDAYIYLYADGPCSTFGNELVLYLDVHQTCPPGFNLSESARSCVCEPRLAQYTNSCTITNGVGQITRDSGQQFWVGYDQSQGVILHPLCPFDYCVSHKVVFPLNNTDIQCAYSRSSLLCGACKEGYSVVLGTFQCKKCTNSHLTLLIPFAMMGVALVLLLLVCKLTVATGTLSGLVFYANIIGVNRTIFLPVESTSAFSIFIAWLNLDFGIETCFYNGLDAYSKTWLQFVFPVCIWVIVGLVILVSNYSSRFANLLGNNPVPILATLILLSYAKILRTLIVAINFTYLEYPTYNRGVWLYDANIDYLSGKHIPLFIVAVLVFLFLFLPYTLLLLFGQWLQAISHLRLFSWINRLKPFMDSYHAPYKAKHRYWPGLLLMVRFVLLLVFALNPQQDPSVILLAILVGTGILHFWAWVSGGVYRSWCLDALEGSFALNLIVLAASTMYICHVNHSHGNQLAVGYTSVSIAFATFIGILVFQLANVTGIIRYLKRKCTVVKTCMIQIRNGEIETESDSDSLPDRLINPGEYEPLLQTAQEHTAAEPIESDDREPNVKRLIPAYTYSFLN